MWRSDSFEALREHGLSVARDSQVKQDFVKDLA